MTTHSVLNVRAAPEWGNSELYKYYERNGLGYGTVQCAMEMVEVPMMDWDFPCSWQMIHLSISSWTSYVIFGQNTVCLAHSRHLSLP